VIKNVVGMFLWKICWHDERRGRVRKSGAGDVDDSIESTTNCPNRFVHVEVDVERAIGRNYFLGEARDDGVGVTAADVAFEIPVEEVDEFLAVPCRKVHIVENYSVVQVSSEIAEGVSSADDERLIELVAGPLGLTGPGRSPDVGIVGERGLECPLAVGEKVTEFLREGLVVSEEFNVGNGSDFDACDLAGFE